MSNNINLSKEYKNKGAEFYRLKNYDEANKYYDRAIEVEPLYASPYYNKAIMLCKLEKWQESIYYYNKAEECCNLSIELNDKFKKQFIVYIYGYKGAALFRLKKYIEAINSLDKAIGLETDDWNVYYLRGIISNNNEEYDKAIYFLDKALELNSSMGLIYYYKGIVFKCLKKYEEALRSFDKAIELKVSSYDVYYNKIFTFRELGQYVNALNCINVALNMYPQQDYLYNVKNELLQLLNASDKGYNRANINFEKSVLNNKTNKINDEKKEVIVSALNSIIDELYKFNNLHIYIKKFSDLINEIQIPLTVVIMGEFKAGKSTFINTLIKEDCLKADVTPATAVVTKLRYGECKSLVAHFRDGSKKIYPLEMLEVLSAEGNSLNEELRAKIGYLEVIMTNPVLKEMTIVDTPGLNSDIQLHTKATKSFIDRADCVIWLFSTGKLGSKTELAAIKELGEILKPIGIVNRIDEIDSEEENVDEILDDIKRKFKGEVRNIIGVSALVAREAMLEGDKEKLRESRWEHLEQVLKKELTEIDECKKCKSTLIRFKKILEMLNKFLQENKKKYLETYNLGEVTELKIIRLKSKIDLYNNLLKKLNLNNYNGLYLKIISILTEKTKIISILAEEINYIGEQVENLTKEATKILSKSVILEFIINLKKKGTDDFYDSLIYKLRVKYTLENDESANVLFGKMVALIPRLMKDDTTWKKANVIASLVVISMVEDAAKELTVEEAVELFCRIAKNSINKTLEEMKPKYFDLCIVENNLKIKLNELKWVLDAKKVVKENLSDLCKI